MIDILIIFGLGFLGQALYAFFEVWKIIKLKEFDHKKFFGENIKFWIVSIALNFIISIILIVAPEFKDTLSSIGFAVNDETKAGLVLLGFGLGAGANETPLTGSKTLQTKRKEILNE